MNTFDEALKRFKTDGLFIYRNASLDTDNIKALQKSLRKLDPKKTYQFHLIDVRLVPKTSRYFVVHGVEKLEKELLAILAPKLAWSSIKIERVYFQQDSEEKCYLSECFYAVLFEHLMQYKALTVLSLDPFSLDITGYTHLFHNFLAKNTSLKDLYLGITAGQSIYDFIDLRLALSTHRGLKQVNFENAKRDFINWVRFPILALSLIHI